METYKYLFVSKKTAIAPWTSMSNGFLYKLEYWNLVAQLDLRGLFQRNQTFAELGSIAEIS